MKNMAKYGKIWQISKIILNHFVRCRLSPLECCVSQGLFDYSTYKSLMARCRRAHSTRQSVHNPYLISDLNLISLVRQCQGSAKAVPRRMKREVKTGHAQNARRLQAAMDQKSLGTTFPRRYEDFMQLVISRHILSYLVVRSGMTGEFKENWTWQSNAQLGSRPRNEGALLGTFKTKASAEAHFWTVRTV